MYFLQPQVTPFAPALQVMYCTLHVNVRIPFPPSLLAAIAFLSWLMATFLLFVPYDGFVNSCSLPFRIHCHVKHSFFASTHT